MPQYFLGFVKEGGGSQKPDGFKVNELHFDNRMPLVVYDLLVSQEVFVHHFLQLKQSSRFVPANISQVIGASAPEIHGFGIPVFLHIYFVERAVSIVPNAKDYRPGKFIVFHQFYITDGMNLFTPANYFIRPVGIHIFNQIRKGHSEKGNLQK
jgi:hypothetical protein